MAINDVYQAVINQRAYNQAIQTVLFYRETSNTPGLHHTELATVLDTNLGPLMASNLHVDYAYVSTSVALVRPLPRTDFVVANAGATGGSLAGLILPINACAVLTKKTGLAGPLYRGRAYISGLTMDDIDDGQLDVSGLANMQDIADELEIPQVSGLITFAPCLFGPMHLGANNTTLISEVIVRPIIRNQRRRQVGVGI